VKHVAILGAGLTGLSAAYHLRTPYEVFEQEDRAGGLCRTMARNGFLFDYTGHLLHVRQSYTKQLIQRLLPDQYQQHDRKALIYSHGRYVRYPFQANLHGLPPEVIRDCLIGFMRTLLAAMPDASPRTFQDWVLQTFGAGIARYFMFPYNQKLWNIALDELSADWVSWSIPKPTLEDVVNGAFGLQDRTFGYNPTFLYPHVGGMEQLPLAFVRHLKPEHVHYAKQAVAIDPVKHCVHFADQSTASYDALLSTMPLKRLVSMLRDAPEGVVHAGEQLRQIAVYDVNIGVKRPHLSESHWMYFPEPEFRFYRVGFPSNFSTTVAPAGCSSMYVEVSVPSDETLSETTLQQQVLDGLRRCGILKDGDEILVCDVVRIDCAYVLYDLHRTEALNSILPYLHEHQIYSTGRYGAWEYASMEDAILAGKQAAESMKC
jgi:protoporphyrinogen oxidase